MTLNCTPRRGRLFPERQLSPQEKTKRQAEMSELNRVGTAIFEQVKFKLIKEHYNWFMVIEPKSGEYFIDPDEIVAKQKAHEKYPHAKCLILRINETGTCGRI